jgi:hypothetical protein
MILDLRLACGENTALVTRTNHKSEIKIRKSTKEDSMGLTRLSVRRPLTMLMIILALVVLGYRGFTSMQVDRFPKVEREENEDNPKRRTAAVAAAIGGRAPKPWSPKS